MLPAVLLLCCLPGCTPELEMRNARFEGHPAPSKKTLTIFAAASLTDVFQEMEKIFEEAHPDVDVVLNFAGSQQLAHQILAGAPADLFASANFAQMERVLNNNQISVADIDTFATTNLVIIAPGDNPKNINSLVDLSKRDLKVVMAAAEVPAGQYTQTMLAKTNLVRELLKES